MTNTDSGARIPAFKPDIDIPDALQRIEQVLSSGWITQGPQVQALERHWSERLDWSYTVAVSSGQNALELALRGLQQRDEDRFESAHFGHVPKVILPANAFVGDLMAVLRLGYAPVFADVDDNLQIDLQSVNARFETYGEAVAGVLCVHMGGWATPNLYALSQLVAGRGCWLLEDAAQAHGVNVKGSMGEWVPVGTLGDASILSFYATKIVTSGEGGLIACNSLAMHDLLQTWRNNGNASVWRTEDAGAVEVAGDCRMSDILAAIAIQSSEALNPAIWRLNTIAQRYLKACPPALQPFQVANVIPNWYKFLVRVDEPQRLALHLEKHDIALGAAVYDRPVYQNGAFSDLVVRDECPRAEELCPRHAAIPLYTRLTETEIVRICQALETFE